MAVTLPNIGIIKSPKGNRYIHRRVVLVPAGSAGSAVATGYANSGPAALMAYMVDYTSAAATTDILLKAESTAGVTIKTLANVATDKALFPLGTTAVDETRAATAATDAFGGGFLVRQGVFVDLAQGDPSTTHDKDVVVDLWLKQLTYVKLDLVSQSGADGAGAVTRSIPLYGAGSLYGLSLTFANMPATTDVVIKADDTNGTTLFTSTSSLTDLAPSILGRSGEDEAVAATAATDGTGSANCFKTGLYVTVAEADAFTSSNERITLEMWIEQ